MRIPINEKALKTSYDADFHRLIGDKQNDYVVGFTAGWHALASSLRDLNEGKAVSEMSNNEMREMMLTWGNVTATYDPIRKKNIVSIEKRENK